MSNTGPDINNKYYIVAGNRLPIKKIQKPKEEITSEQPEQEVDGVSVPLPLLEKINGQMASLQKRVEDLQKTVDSLPSEQRNTHYAKFLGSGATEVDPHQCFVAMPYSQSWSLSLEETLVQICRSVGMKALVAKGMAGQLVVHDMWVGITGSSIIIADITGGNPNVAYEVGLADVLGKQVVLLCQGDTVPFDFEGRRLILYESSLPGVRKLEKELSAALSRLHTT